MHRRFNIIHGRVRGVIRTVIAIQEVQRNAAPVNLVLVW